MEGGRREKAAALIRPPYYKFRFGPGIVVVAMTAGWDRFIADAGHGVDVRCV
jgi:hypothetical protein